MPKISASLTQLQASDLIGLSTRRLQQMLNEDNPPHRDQHGQFPCKLYGEWLRNYFRKNMVVVEGLDEPLDYNAERARLTHHNANIAELDEARKRGELIPRDEVIAEWQMVIASVRAKLLGLPVRLASTCAGEDFRAIEDEARRIVHEALTELGGTDDL